MFGVKHTEAENKSNGNYDELKCTRCDKYLSVPPIFTSHDAKVNICGRCSINQQDTDFSRNSTYEKLAKFMQFPCSESKNCKDILSWGKVTSHEAICSFRKITCPSSKCCELFEVRDIEKHFQLRHNRQFYKSGTVNISYDDQAADVPKTVLINYKNSIFLACISVSNAYFWCEVYLLSTQNNKHVFTLSFSTKTCRINFSTRSNIGPFPGKHCVEVKHRDALMSKKVKKQSLFDILGLDDSTMVMNVDIEIFEVNDTDYGSFRSTKNAKRGELIRQALKCPICFDTMTGYINLCQSGHSVCATCKSRVRSCPVCRNCFDSGRNFALEDLYQKYREHSFNL